MVNSVQGLDSNTEYKMLVVTEEDTIKAQEILREIGFNRRPHNLTTDMMKKDYGDNYVIGSLYFSDSGWISCSSKTSNHYCEVDEYEEITYEELLEIYNTFKEDKMILTAQEAKQAWCDGKGLMYSWLGEDWCNVDGYTELRLFDDEEYKFKLKPITVNINGVEYSDKQEAYDAFMKIHSEM